MKTTYTKSPRDGGGDGLPQPHCSYGPAEMSILRAIYF